MGWKEERILIYGTLDNHGGERQREADRRWDELLGKIRALCDDYRDKPGDPGYIRYLEVH